ncbi:MAG: outer membrane protein transport protein [Acidobacteriota bacterium]
MKSLRHGGRRRALGWLVFLMAPALGHASVAWRPVYGARGLGMGGAVGASATDQSATLLNPALLVEVKHTNATLGAQVFHHPGGITFRRDADDLSPNGYPEQPTDNDSSLAPFTGFVFHKDDSPFAFGLGVNVPFAEDLEWSSTGPQRYWATKSEFSFLYVTPAAAYRVNDWFAFGAGLALVRLDGKVQQKLDFGAIAGQPENIALDGQGDLEGNGTGYGYNAGLLFTPHKKFAIALSYLSGPDFTASGTRKARIPDALQRGLGLPPVITFTDEELDLRMPAVWRLGATLKPIDHVSIVAEIQQVDRKNEKFLLKNRGSTRPDVLPDSEENLVPVPFKSAYSYKLGAEYRLEALALRAGALVDQNGIPDGSMSPAGVDTRKLEVTAGAGYEIKKLTIDFGFAHVMGDTRHVTTSQTVNRLSGRPANGVYEIQSNIFALSASYRF